MGTNKLIPSSSSQLWDDPALQELNDQERIFVCSYCAKGAPTFLNAKASTEAAGYSAESDVSLRVQAHRLCQRERIAEAVDQLLSRYVAPTSQALLQLQDMMQGGLAALADVEVVRNDGGGVDYVLELDIGKAVATGMSHVIKALDHTEEVTEHDDGSRTVTRRSKVRFTDPLQAQALYWKVREQLGADRVERPGAKAGPTEQQQFLVMINEMVVNNGTD